MAKLTLSDLGDIRNPSASTTINTNSALVEGAIENTLSRDGTSPNQMEAALDMNSNAILNLPVPTSPTEPVRLTEFNQLSTAILQGLSFYPNVNGALVTDSNGIALAVTAPAVDYVLSSNSGTPPSFKDPLSILPANLTGWGAKTPPAGDVVGTTDTQVLTNKTLTAPSLTGTVGLASGSVLNWDGGDATLTHSSNNLVLSGTLFAVNGLATGTPAMALKSAASAGDWAMNVAYPYGSGGGTSLASVWTKATGQTAHSSWMYWDYDGSHPGGVPAGTPADRWEAPVAAVFGSTLLIENGNLTTGLNGDFTFYTVPPPGGAYAVGDLITPLQRFTITGVGNIVPGSAALATTATSGFIYQQTCAGTPTGVPTVHTGRSAMVVDTTNDIPYFYDGGWIQIVTPAATQTLTNKTISGATNTLTAVPLETSTGILPRANTLINAIEVFTSSGTATKPTGTIGAWVMAIGPGGAGGSGRRGAAGTVRCGGGGGGAGPTAWQFIPAALMGSTVTVTIGTQAVPGAAIAVDDTDGSAGTNATSTTFGTFVSTSFGTNGGGGTAAAGTAGTSNSGLFNGGNGGAASGTGGAGANGVRASIAGGGGGAGGGISAANADANGGAGAAHGTTYQAAVAGGAGGVAGGAVNGGAGTGVGTNYPIGGAGGGGGAGNSAGAAGTGGAGGTYGAGGGGGGASLNGQLSGAGGAGGAGFCMVIWL